MDERKAQVHYPGLIKQVCLWALLLTLVPSLVAPTVGDAQVATNITSSGLNTTVTQAGNVHNITGGTRPGSGPNLFHSFGEFSVAAGDIGNFLNETGLPTNNVLGRVTGGNISNIYGTVQTTDFGNANLYLMNPFGIVLGPSASLNVGGSVGFTNAQYIRLFDALGANANFYAESANDGLANSILAIDPSAFEFLSASPAAYGFLTAPDPNATITVQGSALSVASGQSISLVGGKVVIEGGAQLSAPNGKIQLASSASPGEFDAATLGSAPNVDFSSFTSFGTVSLAPGASVNVSGTHTVWIKGGQLVLSVNDATLNTLESGAQNPALDTIALGPGSSIMTSNFGADAGADLQITVETLNLDSSTITTETFGDGDGGNITADVGTLSLMNFATISSNNSSFGVGQGGNVTVEGLQGVGSGANLVSLDTGGVIKTETFGPGRGGDLTITALKMQMDNQSEVRTGTFFGGGVGGDLALNVGTLTLNGGSVIRSQDFTFGTDFDFDGIPDIPSTGAAGQVTIQGIQGGGSPAGSVALSGGSQIVSEALDGKGGPLSVKATSISLDGASSINSGTFGFGRGGDIVLSIGNSSLSGGSTIASRPVFFNPIAGEPGNIMVQGLDGNGSKANALTITGFESGILQDTYGTANAGDIVVHANTVSLTDQAVIEGGTTQGEGTGGKVTIEANSVSIADGSHISSQARAQDAGQVTITADQLTIDNGSIETSTSSTIGGRGGDVLLNVGSVNLSNGGTINSSTSQAGRAGDITMNIGGLNLDSGSSISSASIGADPIVNINDGTTEPPGRAGNVTINVTGGFTSDASNIATSAEANHGGDISISAQNVQLSNGSVINASTNGPAQVIRLVLDENGNLVEQLVGDGGAGRISITTTGNPGDLISLASGSTIAGVTTAGGNAGQVILTTPTLNVDNATITTNTSSSGNAGSILAKVSTLTQTNGAEISSNSTGEATGAAGSVTIEGLASPANVVTIINSSLLTSADSTGQGGSIVVDATNISLNNATVSASVNNFDNSPGSSDSATVGLANIDVTASTMTLQGTTVTTESSGLRNAGDIRVNPNVAGNSFEMQNSTINTSASLSDGGNIEINANDIYRMTNSVVTSSVGNPQKTDTLGGNITIDPQNVILQNSQIIAQAFAGTGGNIAITSGVFLADPSSLVDASSALGISGTVDIRSPVSNISGVIGRLPESVLASQALLRAACAARLAESKVSSFVERGRDHIPVGPDGLLAPPYLAPSSEPSTQLSSAQLSDVGVQVRRLMGDLTSRVHLLSGDAACQS